MGVSLIFGIYTFPCVDGIRAWQVFFKVLLKLHLHNTGMPYGQNRVMVTCSMEGLAMVLL